MHGATIKMICPVTILSLHRQVTPSVRINFEKLIFARLIKRLSAFYGTHNFTIVISKVTTGSCPELDPSSPHPKYIFPLDVTNIKHFDINLRIHN